MECSVHSQTSRLLNVWVHTYLRHVLIERMRKVRHSIHVSPMKIVGKSCRIQVRMRRGQRIVIADGVVADLNLKKRGVTVEIRANKIQIKQSLLVGIIHKQRQTATLTTIQPDERQRRATKPGPPVARAVGNQIHYGTIPIQKTHLDLAAIGSFHQRKEKGGRKKEIHDGSLQEQTTGNMK